MKKLKMFIGPPSDPSDDPEAVSSFLAEDGEGVLMGGTTSRIFEKIINDIVQIDIRNDDCGAFRIGRLGELAVTEGSLTLGKLNEILRNGESAEAGPEQNSVGYLKKLLAESDLIKIYHGRAFNPVNGLDKNTVVKEFVEILRKSGKTPEIVNF